MKRNTSIIFTGLWLLITLLAYGYYNTVIYKYNSTTNYIYKSDYSIFYRSTQLYFAGKDIYTPVTKYVKKDNKVIKVLDPNGNLNPPQLTLLILWLGKFKFVFSFLIWLSLSLIAGVISVYLLQRAHGVKTFFNKHTLGISAALLCYYPTFLNYRTGQLSLLLLLGVVLLWFTSRNRQDKLAGFLLGLLLSIKLFLGVFILFFIMQRRWRLLSWTLSTILVGLLLGLLIFGQSAFINFYATLRQAVWFVPNWNASVYGYLFRLVGVLGRGAPVIDLVKAVLILYYMVSAITIGVLIWLSWPNKNFSEDYFDIGFAFTLITCLLLSPLGWNYYFPMLLVVIYIMLRLASKTKKAELFYFLTYIALLLSTFPLRIIKHPEVLSTFMNLAWSSVSFYALFLLLLIPIAIRQALIPNKIAVPNNLYLNKFQQCCYLIILVFAFLPPGLYGACFASYLYS